MKLKVLKYLFREDKFSYTNMQYIIHLNNDEYTFIFFTNCCNKGIIDEFFKNSCNYKWCLLNYKHELFKEYDYLKNFIDYRLNYNCELELDFEEREIF